MKFLEDFGVHGLEAIEARDNDSVGAIGATAFVTVSVADSVSP